MTRRLITEKCFKSKIVSAVMIPIFLSVFLLNNIKLFVFIKPHAVVVAEDISLTLGCSKR